VIGCITIWDSILWRFTNACGQIDVRKIGIGDDRGVAADQRNRVDLVACVDAAPKSGRGGWRTAGKSATVVIRYEEWTFVKNMLGSAPRPGGPASIAPQTGKGMSRTAFRALVAGDVAWLLRQDSTPARDHIFAVLQRCEALFYPDPEAFASNLPVTTRGARASSAAPFTHRRTPAQP
jgi:hypothetical protein